MKLIEKLNYQINLSQLQHEALLILEHYPFNNHNQICFQNTQPNQNDVYEGTGNSQSSLAPSYLKNDHDFKFFNPLFKDTLFYQISQKFPGRMRLNLMKPRTCYSMHTDPHTNRYHIAINTNSQCFILFKKYKPIHIPADGYCYKMDANVEHTALNAGSDDRIHLVISNQKG